MQASWKNMKLLKENWFKSRERTNLKREIMEESMKRFKLKTASENLKDKQAEN